MDRPRSLVFALVALLAFAAIGTAAPAVDTQELVVFGPDRPYWVRLRLEADGQTLSARWEASLRKLFDFFDRDGNGSLSRREAAYLPSAAALAQSFQQGPGPGRQPFAIEPGMAAQPQPNERAKWADLDGDRNGIVTFTEFLTYYRSAQPGVRFHLDATPPAVDPARVNAVLLKLLDTNGDGKLSKEELDAAPERLAHLDADDDECISLSELVPGAAAPAMVALSQRLPVRPPGAAPPPVADGPAVAFSRGAMPATLPKQLIAKYDKDGDGLLSRAEIGFDAATFARLDRDGDGKLDADEVARWFFGRPDQEIQIRLGAGPADCAATAVGRAGPLRALPSAPGRLNLERAGLRVGLAALPPARDPNRIGAREALFQTFREADFGSKGYLDIKDVLNPNFRAAHLDELMAAADRDDNGKLTPAEVNAYLDVMALGAGNAVTVTATARQQSWFELLDADGDGRLSPRELRNAWKRLSASEADGQGFVTAGATRQTLTVYVAQGQQPHPAAFLQPTFDRSARSTRGPLWFRKMDRNGDGDVSPREFLGPPELFKLLDKDGDGLISAAEAEAADPRLVPKSPK